MYISVEHIDNKIYISNINKEGTIDVVTDKGFRPYMFVPDLDGDFSVIKSNIKVSKKYTNLNNFYNIRDKLSLESVYNAISPKYQYISDYFYNKPFEYEKLRHHHVGIKVIQDGGFPSPLEALNKITLIQVYESDINMVYLFGTEDFKEINLVQNSKYNVVYNKFKDEKELLIAYIKFTKDRNPITMNAWFGYSFNFPYLINRCLRLGIDYKDFSPYRKFKKKKVSIFGEITEIIVPQGRYWLDSKEVYEHFSYGSRESYSLEFIAQYELRKGKVKYKNISSNLDEIYNNKYELFVQYSIQDVVLLNDLDNKLDYLNIMMNQAWEMGVNFDDIFSTIKPWTYKLYNDLKLENIVLPINDKIKKENFQGAFILSPIPGLYEYIIAFDVISEYPLSIKANNISFESIVENKDLLKMSDSLKLIELQKILKNNGNEEYLMKSSIEELKRIKTLVSKNNLILSPSGEFFYKDIDAVLPKMVTKIFNEREIAQNKSEQYYNILEMCKRV